MSLDLPLNSPTPYVSFVLSLLVPVTSHHAARYQHQTERTKRTPSFLPKRSLFINSKASRCLNLEHLKGNTEQTLSYRHRTACTAARKQGISLYAYAFSAAVLSCLAASSTHDLNFSPFAWSLHHLTNNGFGVTVQKTVELSRPFERVSSAFQCCHLRFQRRRKVDRRANWYRIVRMFHMLWRESPIRPFAAGSFAPLP